MPLCSLGVATFAESGLSFFIHILIFLTQFGHHLYRVLFLWFPIYTPLLSALIPKFLPIHSLIYLSLDHLIYALPLLLQRSIR
jgi:hypothetical protein